MQPFFAAPSPFLAQKWRDIELEKHRLRIENMKPNIDNRSPKKLSHLKKNAKRMQLDEDRNTEIERENLILLSKMIAMRSPRKGAHANHNTSSSSSSSISMFTSNNNNNNINDINEPQLGHSRNSHYTSNSNDAESLPPIRSLNWVHRKQETERVNEENFKMLQRLRAVKPVVDMSAFEQSGLLQARYLENCSSYPVMTSPSRKQHMVGTLNLSPRMSQVPAQLERFLGEDKERYRHLDDTPVQPYSMSLYDPVKPGGVSSISPSTTRSPRVAKLKGVASPKQHTKTAMDSPVKSSHQKEPEASSNHANNDEIVAVSNGNHDAIAITEAAAPIEDSNAQINDESTMKTIDPSTL